MMALTLLCINTIIPLYAIWVMWQETDAHYHRNKKNLLWWSYMDWFKLNQNSELAYWDQWWFPIKQENKVLKWKSMSQSSPLSSSSSWFIDIFFLFLCSLIFAHFIRLCGYDFDSIRFVFCCCCCCWWLYLWFDLIWFDELRFENDWMNEYIENIYFFPQILGA